ncbi:MAG TPA: NnrS family protein, partial [Gammaproteobacteria bacterium]|nr:NnrS family protein [Gammaproteobacteria bacterium]
DLLMHLESGGFGVPQGLGWRLGVAAVIVLISVVGGRIVPAFTRNWLAKRGETRLPVLKGFVDRAALSTLHAGLILWAFLPAFRPIGGLLLLAAALNVWRLSRWRGPATRSEPLLWILHVGYLWVPVGAALLGASMLTDAVPVAASIHALTAGAIGTMVLAVMTRVSLGHTGHPLAADRTTTAIYLLVNAAAVVRIAAELIGGTNFLPLIELSGALWAGSYALFVIWYGPILLTPRADRRAAA